MSLYLNMVNEDNNNNDNELIYLILFCCSVAFIVLPLFFNIFQLHKQLSLWMHDSILKQTDTPQWILLHTKMIYLIAFVSGSAFSAVALFNTYLFRLSLFGMGLSRYHQRQFNHKRVFSVVLLENIPQAIIQSFALVISVINNNDYSQYVITLFSMLFTIISILLCLFEYCFSTNFIESHTGIMITFHVDSQDIASMNHGKFMNDIVFCNKQLVHYMSQLLNLSNNNQCERLKPKKDVNGAIYTFVVAIDSSNVRQAKKTLTDAIRDDKLQKVCHCVF